MSCRGAGHQYGQKVNDCLWDVSRRMRSVETQTAVDSISRAATYSRTLELPRIQRDPTRNWPGHPLRSQRSESGARSIEELIFARKPTNECGIRRGTGPTPIRDFPRFASSGLRLILAGLITFRTRGEQERVVCTRDPLLCMRGVTNSLIIQ